MSVSIHTVITSVETTASYHQGGVFAAAKVHLVERIPWHEALYFVTTTLTTGTPHLQIVPPLHSMMHAVSTANLHTATAA